MENDKNQYQIPSELKYDGFWESFYSTYEKEDRRLPFYEEVAFYTGGSLRKPWQVEDECIPQLLKKWETLKEELDKLYQNRDTNGVILPMKQAIALLVQFIYWANGEPARLDRIKKLNELTYKPVNATERLEFILVRPSLYHSFMQMAELFEEMGKLYQKKKAMDAKLKKR
jgi:hypothetical protein